MNPRPSTATLAAQSGLSQSTINKRLREGWTVEQAVRTPAMSLSARGRKAKAMGSWKQFGNYFSSQNNVTAATKPE